MTTISYCGGSSYPHSFDHLLYLRRPVCQMLPSPLPLRQTSVNLESSAIISTKLYLSPHSSLHTSAVLCSHLPPTSPHLTSFRLHQIVMMSIRTIFLLAAAFLALVVCVSANISVKGISVTDLAPGGRVTNCVFCPPGYSFATVLNDPATGCRKRSSFKPRETNECGVSEPGRAIFCENQGSASQTCTCRLEIRCVPITA